MAKNRMDLGSHPHRRVDWPPPSVSKVPQTDCPTAFNCPSIKCLCKGDCIVFIIVSIHSPAEKPAAAQTRHSRTVSRSAWAGIDVSLARNLHPAPSGKCTLIFRAVCPIVTRRLATSIRIQRRSGRNLAKKCKNIIIFFSLGIQTSGDNGALEKTGGGARSIKAILATMPLAIQKRNTPVRIRGGAGWMDSDLCSRVGATPGEPGGVATFCPLQRQCRERFTRRYNPER